VSGVDGFVVPEFIVTNFSEFEAVEVGALSKKSAGSPVLRVPVPRRDVVEFDRGWSVVVLVPLVFF